MHRLESVYSFLLQAYGPQGWWPLIGLDNKQSVNITKSGSLKGYHPRDYSYPKTKAQRFEICVGAILTQNTAWPNVERALFQLQKLNILSPQQILDSKIDSIQQAVRPAGYYNQKAKKLKVFAEFYISLKGKTPTRQQLLELWGVGPETADSMLLYAFKVPTFVVDAYTKRILCHLGLCDSNTSYDEVKSLFEKTLKPDLKVYQEFHALLVEHAKRYYYKRPYGELCPLRMIGE